MVQQAEFLPSADNADDGLSSDAGCGGVRVSGVAEGAETVDWLYANVRGLRQAAGELSILADTHRPHFIGLTETHTKADPLPALLPRGYSAVGRLDRTRHGGGVVIAAQSHLLVDSVNLKDYSRLECAEMVGIKYGGRTYICCYTQSAKAAIHLFDVMQSYEADHPEDVIVWMGDFNASNPSYFTTTKKMDYAGVRAQEFGEMYGYSQVVGFPTRKANTLDLIYSKVDCTITPSMKIGTSDHISIYAKFTAVDEVPTAPKRQPILRWDLAPWSHIKGEVKRETDQWDPREFSTVDAAVTSLDSILEKIIVKHVQKTMPRSNPSHPWWNAACDRSYEAKQKAHSQQNQKGLAAATKRCKITQRRAFAKYNNAIKVRLSKLKCTDRQFWQLTKEVGGIASARAAAAPSAEALVNHFADKMSNANGEQEDEYIPVDPLRVPLGSWKIRRGKVLRTLQHLDTSKSANGTPPKFLRECAKELTPVLTKLFSFIVRQVTFPSTWKAGRVTALHKRDSVLLAENYRPVTVLKNLSLVFETVTTSLISG